VKRKIIPGSKKAKLMKKLCLKRPAKGQQHFLKTGARARSGAKSQEK